jgi:hypothetical protein
MRVLGGASAWQYDTFHLDAATSGHALSALGYYTIEQAGLIPALGLQPDKLARCVAPGGYVF